MPASPEEGAWAVTTHATADVCLVLLRVTEAAQLVEMYHDQHHSSAPSGVDGLKARPVNVLIVYLEYSFLQVYLEMEGDYSQWEHQFTD